MFSIVAPTLILFVATATVLPAQVNPDVREAIDRGNARYIAAYANADSKALAMVYDLAGARLNANGSVTLGRDSIALNVGAFLDRVGPVTVTLETTAVWVAGDLAYESGIWAYSYTPSDGRDRNVGGRYVTIWRRQSDGDWRILADMSVPGT